MITSASETFVIRLGAPADRGPITDLILQHGPNQWNHLPEDSVRQHVAAIETGDTQALVAVGASGLIGAITYHIGRLYPQYQLLGREAADHGYIAEAVVRRDHVGLGIGTVLLGSTISELAKRGITEIYAMRHADNIPSGRMMEKRGMVVIDEFDDPDIRPSGSRRTAVTRLILGS